MVVWLGNPGLHRQTNVRDQDGTLEPLSSWVEEPLTQVTLIITQTTRLFGILNELQLKDGTINDAGISDRRVVGYCSGVRFYDDTCAGRHYS